MSNQDKKNSLNEMEYRKLPDEADFFQQMVNPQISNFDSEKFRNGRLVGFGFEVHVGL